MKKYPAKCSVCGEQGHFGRCVAKPVVRRLRVDELMRFAFIWAEQDRASLADAWGAGTPERAECEARVKQLRDYRLKRWGKTRMEAILERPSKTIKITSQQHHMKTIA